MCDWIIGSRINTTLGRIQKFLTKISTCDSVEILKHAERELEEYFQGERQSFDIPLAPYGSPFQLLVWEGLTTVAYGRTMSYKRIAEQILCQNSVRAVANAIGANPLSIFIPCHRIIGSDGSLSGYAGGVEAKKYLLNLEAYNHL